MKNKHILLSVILLACGLAATAQEADTIGVNPHTTIGQERVLPRLTTKIHLQTRAYGDSIVLRWAAEDFVSYNYLARLGVNVLRVPRGIVGDTLNLPDFRIDTLAYELKPLSLEQFQQKYASNDSNAYVAMGLLYGEKKNYHKDEGFMGNTQNQSGDQDISYGLSMLVADWRKDLATDMAVRFTDRTAKRGEIYDYYVQPTVWENNGKLIFEPGVVQDVQNVPYQPESYQPRMQDSLSTPYTLTLGWWDGKHSSFEVERRQLSTLTGQSVQDTWHRITPKPYVPMVEQPEGEDYCVVVDSVPQLGLWAYRVMGYDPFGELTEPAEHEIFVPDVQPPTPPVLKAIVIERPDDNDPMAKVFAHVVWQKDDLEDDLAGYRVYYRPMRDDRGNGWQAMNFNLLPPTDTLLSLDMTGKRTGMMYIAAYDHTGNESKSFMQQILLRDYKAPAVPENLRAEVRPIEIDNDSIDLKTDWAYIDLYWQPRPEDDDIDYFDVAFANDSIHDFLLRNEGGIRQSTFTDSVSLRTNQKYIYYKVRAIDQSTNIGQWSDWIQVERPHITPPTQPHLGLSSHDELTGMHMEWIVGMDADMKEHTLYRRLGENGEEEVIGQWTADTAKVRNYKFIVDDNPPYSAKERYFYWMTSTNASPFVSQSLAVSWKHQGPRMFDIDIMLQGHYSEDEHVCTLAWDVDRSSLPEGDWYWAVFRRGPDAKGFTYYMSVDKETNYYEEYTLEPGQKADYYVRLQFGDGRRSQNSNTVSVQAPEK